MRTRGATSPRSLRHASRARVLAAALLGAILIPTAAWGATGLSGAHSSAESGVSLLGLRALFGGADDDIPGVPLPVSPVAGTLNDTAGIDDWDDVYGVPLGYNQKLTVSMTAVAGTDYDLWLWKPGSTTVYDSNPDPHIANSAQTEHTSTESFWYTAMSGGTYYLDVFTDPGTTPNKGAYTLTWSTQQMTAPDLSISAKPSTIAYKGSTTVTGTVSFEGSPVGSARVLIQRRLAGSNSGWTSLNYGSDGRPKTITDSAGKFTYTVTDITSKSEIRAVVWPSATYGWRHGSAVTVTPRASLTRPYVKTVGGTVYRNRPVWLYGFLKPHHGASAKSVKITAYRSGGGMWQYARNYNYSSYTKYAASMILPEKGTWKLVATTAADSYHAATTSSATYVTVK